MTDFFTHQLVILLPGTKNGFVKPNVAFTGDTTQDALLMAPYISGTPVKMVGDLTIGIAGASDQVIGLLVYDGAGTSPLDGIGGADQSGVLTYVYGLATVKVPTRVIASGVSFAVGDKVYAASAGKLTNDAGTGTVIGTVISTLNQATDGLMVQMSI
jgi:hypothetical protein